MALSLQGGFSFGGINDHQAYAYAGDATWAIVSSPANPWGGRWLERNADASAGLQVSALNGATANLINVWRMGYFDFETAGATNNYHGVFRWITTGTGNDLQVEGRFTQQASGNFKFQLVDLVGTVLGTGTNEYAAGPHLVTTRCNGTAMRVWVDHVLELIVGKTYKPLTVEAWGTGVSVTDTGTRKRRWCHWVCSTSDAADLTETTFYPEVRDLFPASNGTYLEGGDETDCISPYSSPSSVGKIDDWVGGGANDGDTTFNCAEGARTTRNSFVMDDVTTLVEGTLLGVVVVNHLKAGAVAKNCPHDALLRYSGTDVLTALALANTTSYSPFHCAFPTPPGGGSWDTTKVNGCEAGHRKTPISPDANIFVTALAMAVVAVGTVVPSDPGAGHPAMRRHGSILHGRGYGGAGAGGGAQGVRVH